MDFEKNPVTREVSRWLEGKPSVGEEKGKRAEDRRESEFHVDSRPIEPEKRRLRKPSFFKWAIFAALIGYTLISYYHAPILKYVGNYLLVEHSLKKADIIVCLMGSSIERGLGTAELYRMGMAPRVFIGREELPQGIQVLRERGVHYPESRELLAAMLEGLGIPRSAFVFSDSSAAGTIGEARAVRESVLEKGYRSLIIVTSPIHTRRALLTFEKVFEKDDVRILVTPTPYSGFRPDDWWKTRSYVREVIIEYQKLIYYSFKYFW
jgi:uncharacterized SAM-binding protein YcdF (DUF218 family)